MTRIVSLKSLAAVALVLGTLATNATAQAQSDVQFSITLGSPGYMQPAPRYAYPRHVYVQPTPVYVQPAPPYAYPRQVYEQRTPVYVYPRHVYAQPTPVHGWRHQRRNHHDRHENGRGPWGDYDRDGVPNHHDYFPRNPYRR